MVKKATGQTKKAKKKATKAKKKTTTKNRGKLRADRLGEYFLHPDMSLKDLSHMVGVRHKQMQKTLDTEAGKMLQEEIDKEISAALGRVKHKALVYFEKFLDDDSLKPSVRLNALKFVLSRMIEDDQGPLPEALVFDTVITETGVIEKTTRKIYDRTTYKATQDEVERQEVAKAQEFGFIDAEEVSDSETDLI